MSHGHAGDRDHNRAFQLGILLNAAFILVEVVFGLRAGSLALLADAGHNFSDVLGLLLAWGATWLAARPPTERRTYGLRRSTILAAMLNALLLLVAIGGIGWEAVQRLREPAPVMGTTVILVAAAGVVINGATAVLFLSGGRRDINIRGAFLHMAADAAVSLGVVLAGFAILATGWFALDPLVSLCVALVIAVGTWGLLRESLDLAVDAVPEGIDPVAVAAHLAALPGVAGVHDLHIWGMSTTQAALIVHVVRPGAGIDDSFVALVCRELHERFGIEHATIQMESGDAANPCDRASNGEI